MVKQTQTIADELSECVWPFVKLALKGLRRQRQYNINMLFDKLMVEFEDHFKCRLLSVADETFDGDGVYSHRFEELLRYIQKLWSLFNLVMTYIVVIPKVHKVYMAINF